MELQEKGRKHILHARSRLTSAIDLNMRTYALKNANDIRNNFPYKEDAIYPLKRYSQVQVSPKIRFHHTFGCPDYALNNCLQEGGRHPKLEARATIGINLGPSPRHILSVALILNLYTGLVSQTFHIQFDDLFETVRSLSSNLPTFSQLHIISGLNTGKVKIVLPLNGDHIAPDSLLPTREETSVK